MATNARDAHLDQMLSWWTALGKNSEKLYGKGKAARDAQLKKGVESTQNFVSNAGTVTDAAGKVVSGTFDIVLWLKDNWQIAIVGVVALLVLLKD